MLTILKNIRNGEHIIIVETIHFLERTNRKYCGYELSYELLKTKNPIIIEYQELNKFKIFFPHPDNEKYNLIIIIFIENIDEIRILTTFPEEACIL